MATDIFRMMRSLVVQEHEAVEIAAKLIEEGWILLPEHTTFDDSSDVRMVRLVFGSHGSRIAPPPRQQSGATISRGENGPLSG